MSEEIKVDYYADVVVEVSEQEVRDAFPGYVEQHDINSDTPLDSIWKDVAEWAARTKIQPTLSEAKEVGIEIHIDECKGVWEEQ